MTSAEARFLRVAVAQAAVVAVLAGVVARLAVLPVPFMYNSLRFGASGSGPAASLVKPLLGALLVAVVALYVVIPTAVAAYGYRYGDLDPLQYLLSGAIAVLLLPVFAGAAAAVIQTTVALLGVLLFLVLLLGFGVFVVSARAGDDSGGRADDSDPDAQTPVATFLNLALVCTVFVGYLVGGVGGAAISNDLVEVEQYGGMAPMVEFDFNYTETDEGRLLRITHDEGDAVRSDRLYVRGTGFADHPLANQSGNESWRGQTSASFDTDNGSIPAVTANDTTAVGVTADCELRVVHQRGDVSATLAVFDCAEDADG